MVREADSDEVKLAREITVYDATSKQIEQTGKLRNDMDVVGMTSETASGPKKIGAAALNRYQLREQQASQHAQMLLEQGHADASEIQVPIQPVQTEIREPVAQLTSQPVIVNVQQPMSPQLVELTAQQKVVQNGDEQEELPSFESFLEDNSEEQSENDDDDDEEEEILPTFAPSG